MALTPPGGQDIGLFDQFGILHRPTYVNDTAVKVACPGEGIRRLQLGPVPVDGNAWLCPLCWELPHPAPGLPS